MCSLVMSIFLCPCESWTLTAWLEKRTQILKMKCYRRFVIISYKDHVTKEDVCRKIQTAIEKYDEVLTLDKKRKLRWFCYIPRPFCVAGLCHFVCSCFCGKNTPRIKDEQKAMLKDEKTPCKKTKIRHVK